MDVASWLRNLDFKPLKIFYFYRLLPIPEWSAEVKKQKAGGKPIDMP
jgi:hypothetical protein